MIDIIAMILGLGILIAIAIFGAALLLFRFWFREWPWAESVDDEADQLGLPRARR